MIKMIGLTLITVLLSLASVDSGNNSPPLTATVRNVPHGFHHVARNNSISSKRANIPIAIQQHIAAPPPKVEETSTPTPTATQAAVSRDKRGRYKYLKLSLHAHKWHLKWLNPCQGRYP